jgi:hypothetical protein
MWGLQAFFEMEQLTSLAELVAEGEVIRLMNILFQQSTPTKET